MYLDYFLKHSELFSGWNFSLFVNKYIWVDLKYLNFR